MNISPDLVFIEKLGANLRQIRKSKGFSQEELSNKAEIKRSQVSRIERGVANPTIKTLKVIADVLEVEICDLVTFE